MPKPIIGGVMPAFITPFTEDGKINEATVKELIDYHIENGLDGLYVGGSTGEGMIMSPEERMQLAEIAVSYTAGRVPVIIHVGTADTDTAVKLAKHAEKIGADGISSVPPYYYKMAKEYIKQYYLDVAGSVNIPLLIYNIPVLTGISIGYDFMVEMIQVKNIIGLKFTDTNLEVFRKMKAYNNGQIKAFIGYDAMLLCSLIMGGDGGIGSFYNIMPKGFATVFDSYRKGDYETAREVMWKIASYIAIMKNYLAAANQPLVKAVLRELGFNCGPTKRPLLPQPESVEKAMIEDLRKNGFFEFVK